jgi:hypothetical protein
MGKRVEVTVQGFPMTANVVSGPHTDADGTELQLVKMEDTGMHLLVESDNLVEIEER